MLWLLGHHIVEEGDLHTLSQFISLLITAFLVPYILALPFYGLELLIGAIQGFIFAGLTLVFVTMAVTSHAEEAH